MPFTSKSQMRTCFSRQLQAKSQGKPWTWDCKLWAKETSDISSLPEKVSGSSHKSQASSKSGKSKPSRVYQGSRGGYYFYIDNVKVYVPHGTEEVAKRLYGYAGRE